MAVNRACSALSRRERGFESRRGYEGTSELLCRSEALGLRPNRIASTDMVCEFLVLSVAS
jgi:hypothetical protein